MKRMEGCKEQVLVMLVGIITVILSSSLTSGQIVKDAANSRNRAEQNILSKLLTNSSYDRQLRPEGNGTSDSFVSTNGNGRGGDGPTVIEVSYYVRNVDALDSRRQEMKIQLTLKQTWNDPKLSYLNYNAHKLSYVTLKKADDIWLPDLHVTNSKEDAKILATSQANSYVRIFPNGLVVSSQKVSLTLGCPMNFANFPFDSQTCEVRLAGYYGYLTQDVVYKWKQGSPVQFISGLAIQDYVLAGNVVDNCDTSNNMGSRSCLKSSLTFKRLTHCYTMQVFIPCTMLLLISWLAFWLPPNQVLPRLIVTIATLFVAVTQTAHLNEKLPQAPYNKAVDVWTGICITFLLIALAETITVFYLFIKQQERVRNDADSAINKYTARHAHTRSNHSSLDTRPLQSDTDTQPSWLRIEPQKASSTLDFACRIGYPIAFALFALVYFLVYRLD